MLLSDFLFFKLCAIVVKYILDLTKKERGLGVRNN